MSFGMGFGELVLILVIVVVVFGATKLPQLGDGLGESVRRLQERQQLERPHLLLRRRSSRRWTISDWLLVVAAIAVGTFVIANALRAAVRGR
jgi:TatA/E family protein of Tat protein translocase